MRRRLVLREWFVLSRLLDAFGLCRVEIGWGLVWFGVLSSSASLRRVMLMDIYAIFRGVQALAAPADLDKHIAEEDVLYLLLHSPSDTEILVRPLLSYQKLN